MFHALKYSPKVTAISLLKCYINTPANNLKPRVIFLKTLAPSQLTAMQCQPISINIFRLYVHQMHKNKQDLAFVKSKK